MAMTGAGPGQISASVPTVHDDVVVLTPADFALLSFSGGPLNRFWRKLQPAADSRQLLRNKVLVLAFVTWPPLLLLSVAEGRAWGGAVAVPFLYDVQLHARLLLALPLLIVAELIVHQRMQTIVGQFLGRGLIPDDARARYDTALAGAVRLAGSLAAEVLLFAMVYAVGVGVVWRTRGSLDVASWYGASAGAAWRPSLAGWWLILVSLPVFQFLMVRWYFRLFVWARFLWQVARHKLLLEPTDPDRAGGLGFLAGVGRAFATVLLAVGTLVAGTLANRIFYEGATLLQFNIELFGTAALMALVILGPLLAFTPQLAAARRLGNRTFGIMAHGYARDFGNKWLRGRAAPGEPLLGSEDIQALADLGQAFDAVKGMRMVPFTAATVTEVAALTLAPILPLALTMMPLEEAIRRLLKILF
jgi:hypothetical protein